MLNSHDLNHLQDAGYSSSFEGARSRLGRVEEVVGNIRIFERTIWPTFEAEECLSAKLYVIVETAYPPKVQVLISALGCIFVRAAVWKFARVICGKVRKKRGEEGPSYLIPVFPWEQFLEKLLGPCRVLLRYTRMPPIQQIEFDGYDVSFPSGREGVFDEIPGSLAKWKSVTNRLLSRYR